jgi:hypothetical protein
MRFFGKVKSAVAPFLYDSQLLAGPTLSGIISALRYVHRPQIARTNIARWEPNSYAGSQNGSGYGRKTDFLGLAQLAATYHLFPICSLCFKGYASDLSFP